MHQHFAEDYGLVVHSMLTTNDTKGYKQNIPFMSTMAMIMFLGSILTLTRVFLKFVIDPSISN